MQRNYNNRSIEKILNTIKELVDISSNKEKISVDLEITTTDGYTNKIQINKENDSKEYENTKKEVMTELKKEVKFSFWEKYDENHTVVRFATSWATKKEEIDQLLDLF